ncbi:M56 family metallopeptidase [Sphingopyxis sp.]|uniref:M56 family metallopeptidase n=1 Tax=Sphingopyxis sp. TaxID=1908224 RepID=UPI003D125321
MSAATWMQVWSDTLITTALLVLAVLLVRKPFARQFGPRLAYILWLIPALRLILPPMPFADPVATPDAVEMMMVAVDAPMTAPAPPAWSLADAMPYVFVLWAIGMIAVLGVALLSHRRFRAAVLAGAVELQSIGRIRLVMTDAVDGPVAFGLLHRVIAVPQDFFARYAADERALAVDHELAHHRHGDLWANAAALVLLASQWFNPLAWRAIRAFRFDQEAACDARVLMMADQNARGERAARYATAIAKAAVGTRLSLAAPMAVHDNLQERLTMLMRRDISKQRGLAGRLLIGGATLAVLTTTATLVPAGIASAMVHPVDEAAPPEPPAKPLGPPEAPDSPGLIIFTERSGAAKADQTGKAREVRRIVFRRDGHGEAEADAEAESKPRTAVIIPADGGDRVRHVQIRGSSRLWNDDAELRLKEESAARKWAEKTAEKLEAKRKERIRVVLAPMPPMPPMSPMRPMPSTPHGAWATVNGQAMVLGKCVDGKRAATIVNRDESDGNNRSRVHIFACNDTPEGSAARLSALKKAREAFADGERARGMSEDMRAKVAADLEKAIAEIEKSGN